jgi:hypothetical protein
VGVAVACIGALLLGGWTAAGSSDRRVVLRIAIAESADSNAPAPRVWRLNCRPGGGDWPRRADACRRLTRSLLAPITVELRDIVPITSQPVRFAGTAFGRRVSLRFDTEGSSTRRERLRALRRALGPSAYTEAQRRSR